MDEAAAEMRQEIRQMFGTSFQQISAVQFGLYLLSPEAQQGQTAELYAAARVLADRVQPMQQDYGTHLRASYAASVILNTTQEMLGADGLQIVNADEFKSGLINLMPAVSQALSQTPKSR